MSLKWSVRNWCVILPIILWIMNLERAQVGRSLLGFLFHLHSDVVPVLAIQGLPWAAHPSSLLTWLAADDGHQGPAQWVLSTRTPMGGPFSYWDFWHGIWLHSEPHPRRTQGKPHCLLRPDQKFTQYHCFSCCCWKQPGLAIGSELLWRRGVKSF